MNTIIQQNKPFFKFLFKFLSFYVLFTLVYKFYLTQFNSDKNEVDTITNFVANRTVDFLSFFGDSGCVNHEKEASLKIYFNGKYIARIIEGCNVVSVVILFAAFIFAFSSTVKKTFLFICGGVLLLFVLNIIRIGLLSLSMFYYPEYEEFLHDIVFPLTIYGIVFLLWIFWVLKFSNYEK